MKPQTPRWWGPISYSDLIARKVGALLEPDVSGPRFFLISVISGHRSLSPDPGLVLYRPSVPPASFRGDFHGS